MIVLGQGGGNSISRSFLGRALNSIQRRGARRSGRVGKFFSAWNARSDRKMFRKTWKI